MTSPTPEEAARPQENTLYLVSEEVKFDRGGQPIGSLKTYKVLGRDDRVQGALRILADKLDEVGGFVNELKMNKVYHHEAKLGQIWITVTVAGGETLASGRPSSGWDDWMEGEEKS